MMRKKTLVALFLLLAFAFGSVACDDTDLIPDGGVLRQKMRIVVYNRDGEQVYFHTADEAEITGGRTVTFSYNGFTRQITAFRDQELWIRVNYPDTCGVVEFRLFEADWSVFMEYGTEEPVTFPTESGQKALVYPVKVGKTKIIVPDLERLQDCLP